MSVSFSDLRRTLRPLLRRSSPEYASTISLLACVLLALGSIGLGALQQSLVVQTNGFISLIDIGNSVLFLAAVQRSTRSADPTFNYGYGKYESLAILVSATLLVVLALFTLAEAVTHVRRPPESYNVTLLLGWGVGSWFIMRYTARLLERYAGRFHMPMLRYDAELWRLDSRIEIGIVITIGAGAIAMAMGYRDAASILDSVSSIALVLLSLSVPLRHGQEAIKQLLDRTLPDTMQFEILAIIAENYSHMCEFKQVHTRQSGKDIFIEIDLVMPFDYTLDELYELERSILERIRERFPTAVPRVYVTPCDHGCMRDGVSTCPIKVAAARRA
jgi:cation diffusion facilitator family transporter